MDSAPAPGDEGQAVDESGETRAKVHYSTGRLTPGQAGTINRWRRQLTIAGQWSTRDRRPPASSSDCVAAAVQDLLHTAEPDLYALMQYNARIREKLSRSARSFAASPGVSFYLPADDADRLDRLLRDGYQLHGQILDDIVGNLAADAPELTGGQRRHLLVALAAERGIPLKLYRLPAGTIARMAIDRWGNRTAVWVVNQAVAYARANHLEPHRARVDMGVE
ncbi:hypothetical protein AB0C65_35960 [Nocardia sp. NPDC048505]|uniref:hypothetical protein n=1 Tax=Nocardia sp. NPDC048505 TaxID=3155756 RepID=UPI0033E503F0